MGTTWTMTITCLDCGFIEKRSMRSWGDSDCEDEEVHSHECTFCRHATALGIPLSSYLPSHPSIRKGETTMKDVRQTGRTTRMLKEAKKLAEEGRTVYVMMDSAREVQRMQVEAHRLGISRGVKFETPETLGFEGVDWQTMKMRDAHPNCVLLVDHHVIEDRFGPLLEMLHRFEC